MNREPPGVSVRSRALGSLLVGLFCLAAACFYLHATRERLAGSLLPDPGDPVFNLYLLRWGAHQIGAGLPDVWNASFFYPVKGTLALSDHLLGLAAQFLLADLAGATPALGYNVLLLTSFALGGAVLYWIAVSCGLSSGAALVAAFAYSFSLARWRELSHLQILVTQWLPATLWTFDRLLSRRTARAAALFLAAYALHVFGGSYLAYMVHLGLAVILISRWRADGRAFWRRNGLGVLSAAGLASLALAASVFLPYLRLRNALDVVTGYVELDSRRVTLESLVTTGSRTRYVNWFGLPGLDTPALWLGFVPLALLLPVVLPAIGRLAGVVRRAVPRERLVLLFVLIAMAASFALCDFATRQLDLTYLPERRTLKPLYRGAGWLILLGAWLLWRRLSASRPMDAVARDPWWQSLVGIAALSYFAAHTAGYFPLRDLLPGFGSIRVPSRFALLAAPSVCLAIGVGVDRIAAAVAWRAHRARLIVPAVALALLGFEMQPRARHLEWTAIEAPTQFPPAVKWLTHQPDHRASVELPLLLGWREARRMYFSTLHFRPLVNGYSGYTPPFYQKVEKRFGALPRAQAIEWLHGLGVTHVVVHLDELAKRPRRGFELWRRSAEQFEPVRARTAFEDRGTIVLRLESTHEAVSEAPTGGAAALN